MLVSISMEIYYLEFPPWHRKMKFWDLVVITKSLGLQISRPINVPSLQNLTNHFFHISRLKWMR